MDIELFCSDINGLNNEIRNKMTGIHWRKNADSVYSVVVVRSGSRPSISWIVLLHLSLTFK